MANQFLDANGLNYYNQNLDTKIATAFENITKEKGVDIVDGAIKLPKNENKCTELSADGILRFYNQSGDTEYTMNDISTFIENMRYTYRFPEAEGTLVVESEPGVLDSKLNTLDLELKTLDSELDTLENGIDQRLSGLYTDVMEDVNKVDEKVDAVNEKVNLKQDALPINDSGSTQRVWVAPSQALTKNGQKVQSVKLGDITFNNPPTLDSKCTAKIKNIGDLEFADVYPWNYTFAGILARVTELYSVDKNSVEATVKDNKVTFYWVGASYVKRITAEKGGNGPTNASSAGADVGVITMANFFAKWKNGDINADCPLVGSLTDDTIAKKYYAYIKSRYKWIVVDGNPVDVSTLYPNGYHSDPETDTEDSFGIVNFEYFHKLTKSGTTVTKFASNNPDNGFYFSIFNASENKEPYSHTIASRDDEGRLTVEDATKAFHAVNKRQLESTLATTGSQMIKNAFNKYADDCFIYRSVVQSGTESEPGWYTIAELPPSLYANNSFRVLVSGEGFTTQIIFNASALEYDAQQSSIGIIAWDSRFGVAASKLRIVANKSSNSKEKLPVELQIYVDVKEFSISVQRDTNVTHHNVFTVWQSPTYINGNGNQVEGIHRSAEIIEEKQTALCVTDISTAPILSKNVATRNDLDNYKIKVVDTYSQAEADPKTIYFVKG